MKRFTLITACALAGGMYCAAAGAQGTLAAALEAAWQRSVHAPAAAGGVARARAGQAAAGTLWAAPPALELAHRGDPLAGTAGQRESEVGLYWPLLLPGERAARGAAAQADLDAAVAAEQAAKLLLAGELRELAWAMIALRAEARLAQAQSGSLRSLAADVARRVAAGDLARVDLLAAQAEQAAAEAAAAQAQQRLAAQAGRWRLLTGMEPPQELAPEDITGAAPEHPRLAMAELAAESARKRLALVAASRRDAPELMLRMRREVSAASLPAENSLAVGVRIPLGTADRNAPREAAALAELDVAQAEARRMRQQLESEAITARSALEAAARQLTSAAARAGMLRERAQLLDQAFRAGEAPLAELLRALAGAAEAEAGIERQRAELGLAHAQLRQTLGILP